jgi:phosphoribosyl 1,2-cyclic phosphodiesterase
MLVHFWGTRGSISNSITAQLIRKKLFNALKKSRDFELDTDDKVNLFIDNELSFSVSGSFGSNTSCMEMRDNREFVICDCGTGLRDFGNYISSLAQQGKMEFPKTFHLFVSHLHWDHIQGFPFFMPAHIPGNKIKIYGFHSDMEQAFIDQQKVRNFPLSLKDMRGDISFTVLDINKEHLIAGYKVTGMKQNHPGESYGYCLKKYDKKIVYSTDAEHKIDSESEEYSFVNFFRNADLLVFDAQYTLLDCIDTKEDWGHSSNMLGVELSVRSNVKRLCLFHNEHTYNDEDLEKSLLDGRKYVKLYDKDYDLDVHMAYDGLEIEV